VSLFGRIAWTGAALLLVAALLALLWKPAAERAFVSRTEGLLRDAERHTEAMATSLVNRAMEFSALSALAADERRALGVEDLALDLYTDAEGRLDARRLREGLRALMADPGGAGGEKHAAVRAEILERTRGAVQERLLELRRARGAAAEGHAEDATRRTLTAWGGILLVLLGAWAFLLDRVVVRPVRETTAAVAGFGAGERGLRIAPKGASELVSLARAFNETAARVEAAERENAELRARLEEKVKERTQALVRAARASTAGTMAGGIAHEFNNLLGGILGCAETALSEDPSPDVRDSLEMIRKTAGRGVGITSALLRATRAEPERAPCDAATLMEEALEQARPPANVEITRDLGPVPLEADATMLRQVLGNLIRNAVEAMGGAGALRLATRAEGGEAVLVVEDSGPGIAEAVKEVLFEPFVTTRRGGREGAGLGLFLADRLVAAHGGRIEVQSEPGKGARFIVRLPRG
jgi:signal transduction histidine kinase